jgi:hypothetical protein
MSITSTLIVPARVIPRVRESLYVYVRDVSELIDRASMQADREEDPSAFAEARRHLDVMPAPLRTRRSSGFAGVCATASPRSPSSWRPIRLWTLMRGSC